MNHRSCRTTARLALAAALLAAACVDLQPDPPPVVRWISIGDDGARAAVEMPTPENPRLQVQSVTAADSIGDLLITRTSAFEVVYDDYARWIEPPERFVARALEEELYRRRGFRTWGDGPLRTLVVRLEAFEVALRPRREAVVRISVQVRGEENVMVVDRPVEARTPLDSEDPAVAAQGMTASLLSVVQELSDLLATK